MRTFADLMALVAAAPPEVPAADPVSNFTIDVDEAGGEVTLPIPMADVITRIMKQTDGWPRRVGSSLFVHDAEGVHWISNAPSLFGWLATRVGIVEWRRASGCVTKEELFHELQRTAQSYQAVEMLPHFPPLADHYYACEEYPPGDGEALSKLIRSFSPATEEDEDLILAMFATPFWGGKPGSRPAFLVTSDAGRGIGKSKITDMLSLLLGGHVELSAGEDAGRLRSRLLSPDGMKLRLARLDNVKTLKFSWAELESIITSPLISGHRLHEGEAGRPNNITWVITLNGASLSTDMAQRVIMVKLKKPNRMGAWEADVTAHIEANRKAIIGDIRTVLEGDPFPVPDHTRWAAWEDNVLGRLGDPIKAKHLISERAGSADVEAEEVEIVEQYFASQAVWLEIREDTPFFIPSKIAAEWFLKATNEKNKSVVASCRVLSQFIAEGKMISMIPFRTKSIRGFIFCANAEFLHSETAIEKKAIFDIEERILVKTTGKNRDGQHW